MKRAALIGLGVVGLLMLVAACGLLVLRTQWFRERLRERAIAEIETATGGRAELGRLDFDPRRWHARLERLTIHGTELPGEPPLFTVEAVEIDLQVVSFLKRRVDVAALRLLAPEIHLRVAADGATNLPRPGSRPNRAFTDDLLDLAARRFAIERGAFWLNDRRYPVEVSAAGLRMQARLDPAGVYVGRFEAGRATLASLPRAPSIEQASSEFRLLRDRIEISNFTARTAQSECKVQGVITNLLDPRSSFRYEATADAREIASTLSIPELRSGRIQVRGLFESARADWKAAGKVTARDVNAATKEIRINGAALDADYSAGPRECRVEKFDARLLGGEWKGQLVAELEKDLLPARVSLDGRLTGVRLRAVAEALAGSPWRLSELGWTAVVGGTVSARLGPPWSARGLKLDAALAIEPSTESGGTPVRGTLRGSYDGRASELQLDEAQLATPATSLAASGRLRRASGSSVQFRLETSRLEELTRAASAFSASRVESPVKLSGSARVQGTITGTPEQPQVDANVDVTRFAFQGRDWDSFAGRVQWSPQRLRLTSGRLVKDKAVLNANLTARLDGGKFTETSPIEADVSVRDVQVQDLAALAGVKAPGEGAVTATMKLEGTQKDPRGAGRVEVRRATIGGEPFDVVRASVALQGGEVRWSSAQLVKGTSVIGSSGAFHPERRTFRLDARANGVPLASVQWLANRGQKITGSGSFELTASGRLAAGNNMEDLAVDGTLSVRKLAFDGEPIGDIAATARTDRGRLIVRLESNAAGARITGEATVTPRDPFPLEARLQFQNANLAPVLRGAGLGAAASADGALALKGDARKPSTMTGTLDLARLEAEWSAGSESQRRWTLRNAEPIRARIGNDKLTIESAHLTGQGTDLRATGSLDLASPGALNLNAVGNLNLAALASLVAKTSVTGTSTLNAAITGTRQRPQISGRLEVHDASAVAEDLPVSFNNANGVVRFSGQSATIEKLTAEVGGGEVSITGDAAFAGRPVTYRVRAEGRQVRVRYPRGLSSVCDGVFTLNGAGQQSVLGGDIRISRSGTRAAVDLGALFSMLKEPARAPGRNDWLQGMQLNINIVSAPDMLFETSIARNLQANANLHVQGSALNPALLGRINITQGDFEFQGTRFSITRGELLFTNPFRIEPILNLDLETRVSGYDISLTLAGPTDKPNVSYRSDPPLPFDEVVTLLAVGRAPTTDPTLAARQSLQARSLSQLEASSVVGQAISRPAGGRLQRFFGVSRLKLDPELLGPEGNPNARVTLEQQVGRDITFTYVYNLASAQEQIIRVQWAISKQLSLIAVRDQNGVFGLDFLYKKRYR